MKYGIYYAYWEKEWGGQFVSYIRKCKRLGFDILEVACCDFDKENDSFFHELRVVSCANDILLTGGYGPRLEHNLASVDSDLVAGAFRFYSDMFRKMELAGIDRIGGALYSYWPVNFSGRIDKARDFDRSVKNMIKLADMAQDHGITLNMEVLNRFEGYMINEASEVVDYVKAVNKPNVKAMLDTFHMNIEEDSLIDAIRKTKGCLGHFHVGEANRRCPSPDGRIDWVAIGQALQDIQYDGYVILEPFVMMGGQVGKDIFIWRDMSHGATVQQLDADAAASVTYLRKVMG